ncbi:MAG: hypothetical protein ACRD3C_15225 [Vicinamibacterales bacterium]
MPSTSTARRIPPLLKLWAMLVAAVFTFSGAKINLLFIQVLFDGARSPAYYQPRTTPSEARIIRDT